MFGELLESRARRRRNRGGTLVSIVGHALLIALAVVGTRTQLAARAPVERLVPLPMLTPVTARPKDPAPPPTPARRSTTATPSVPSPSPIIAPVIVPVGIPPIDITRSGTTDIAWQSDGQATTSDVSMQPVGDGIPFASGVDKPAIELPGNPTPRYPDILRRASVRGEVVIQVVIDTTGRADMTSVRVVSSDHPLLTDAVLAVLPRARFLPAESAGRKVPMWAVQSFVFEVK